MLSASFLFSSLLSIWIVKATSAFNFNSDQLVVLETVDSPPSRFIARGPAPSDAELSLRIALRQNNISGLEQALLRASTPGSAQYGAWLSREDIASYVRPTTETYDLVVDWLEENGVAGRTNASFAGDWVQFSLSVSQANAMLDAQFQTYLDTSTGLEVIRTLSYAIPGTLQGHVDVIHPTINFPTAGPLSVKRKSQSTANKKRSSVPTTCQTNITPACIQDLYGLPKALVSNPSSLSLWILEYAQNFLDRQDLSTFLSTYRPDISNPFPPGVVDFAVISVDNGTNSNNPNNASSEACLDFEYVAGIASGVPLTMVTTGISALTQPAFIDLVLDSAIYMAGAEEVPTVVSTSYGTNENEISSALAISTCNVFMQLGARGSSVIFSSGDGGVGGAIPICDDGPAFVPSFPSTCPYVTSVGATQLTADSTEVAVNLTEQTWDTAGGFSDIFARPRYQDAAVVPYLTALGNTNAGLYNTSGRGFPDVSAIGVDFDIVCGGQNLTGDNAVGGTSASAPTFASVIALLNDVRLSAGKPVLGFLNPFLYSLANASFTDIVEGDNPGFGCGPNSFNATVGWDPVTGLGTPIFAQLKKVVLSS